MVKANIHLFYGEDTYSAWQKSQYWKREFEKKYGEFNAITLEGAALTAADFRETVDSVPFLGEKKFILIRDFLRDGKDDDQKTVAEKLENIPDFSFVLFLEQEKPDARTSLFKTLKKMAKVEEFQPILGPQLAGWIQEQVQERGGKIGRSEAAQLAETVGPNLWQMSQEIEKLLTYANGSPIPSEAIENMASPNVSSSIFKLTDYLGQKNAKSAVKTFDILLESGEDIVKSMFMIVRHFRILIQVKSCTEQRMEKTAITQKLKEHPFVISTALGQSKNFSSELLASVYRKLLQIDTNMKSGKIHMTAGDNTELRLAIEKLIVEICRT
ncbi:MAG: DNA polymerase III subunit delta [Candidatus Gracilibacteria bacterium]